MLNVMLRELFAPRAAQMKTSFFFATALSAFTAGEVLAKQSQDQVMLILTPETRLEQRCNARAMSTVNREHKNFRTDELVAYAFAETVIRGDLIQASGGAVRNGNTPYHISYVWQTSDHSLGIKSFSYQLGAAVPKGDWEKHFLVPQ